MATYFEYGVKLSEGQKSKLLKAIQNKSAITLRLKHSHLSGHDELMLTQRQIQKIKKSLADGTGTDLKISETQITRSVKHGGNLFSSLIKLGSKLVPVAVKGFSKIAPEVAKGAASALGDLGIKKLFGKGIVIPKKYLPFLPPFAREFTQAQIDLINKAYNTGGKLVIRPTQKQIEGGFLGTLAAIGIPAAISLASKLFGSGLQVDSGMPSNTRNVYVPSSKEGGHFPPPFFGTWENPIGMGIKKEKKKTQSQRSMKHFITKPLSNFDLMEWVKQLGIKHFRGIYSRDRLPKQIKKECGIINLDTFKGPGTHWVCYRNLDSVVEYFDPFGLIMPNEALSYFRTSGKHIVYSMDEIQNRSTVLCGYWCLYYLLERQNGKGILDIIHNPHFDNDNSDFIKDYFERKDK